MYFVTYELFKVSPETSKLVLVMAALRPIISATLNYEKLTCFQWVRHCTSLFQGQTRSIYILIVNKCQCFTKLT